MQKIASIMIFAVIFAAGCGTINQNIQARKNLSKCKYDLERIELKKVNLKGLEIRSIDFTGYLKITNTTTGEVALDYIDGDIYLDKYKTSTLAHNRLLRIKAGASVVEELLLQVPFESALKALGHRPADITVVARLHMNLLIGSFTLPTPIVIEVRKKFPIPYDKIEDAIVKQTKNINGNTVKKKLKKIF